VRPTFGEGDSTTIETHLLGFERDLYGAPMRLGFVQRLRDERVFEGIDQLRAQIEADRQRARSLFERMSL
jgi:riboflavin kinase/FMN adenylyltransferase